jgi:hypothetical protein
MVHVSKVQADHPVAALCRFRRTAARSSSFLPDCGTGTPRESRYDLRRDSLHVATAELKRSSAFNWASSVAFEYSFPARVVAAPNADFPESLALLAFEMS